MSEGIRARHSSACRYKNEIPEGLRRSARRTHFWPRDVSNYAIQNPPHTWPSLSVHLRTWFCGSETGGTCVVSCTLARASPATQLCSSRSAVRLAPVHGIAVRGKHNQGTDVPRSPGTGEPRDVSLRFLQCCFSKIFSGKQCLNRLQCKLGLPITSSHITIPFAHPLRGLPRPATKRVWKAQRRAAVERTSVPGGFAWRRKSCPAGRTC